MKKERLLLSIGQLNSTLLKTVGQDIYQYGITPTEFHILSHLKKKDREKTQKLAEISSITSGAITYVIKKLKEKNYIHTYKDQNDKRVTWVTLSKEGKLFYQQMYPKHMTYVDNLFKSFSEDEIISLQKQIKVFEKKLRRLK